MLNLTRYRVHPQGLRHFVSPAGHHYGIHRTLPVPVRLMLDLPRDLVYAFHRTRARCYL